MRTLSTLLLLSALALPNAVFADSTCDPSKTKVNDPNNCAFSQMKEEVGYNPAQVPANLPQSCNPVVWAYLSKKGTVAAQKKLAAEAAVLNTVKTTAKDPCIAGLVAIKPQIQQAAGHIANNLTRQEYKVAADLSKYLGIEASKVMDFMGSVDVTGMVVGKFTDQITNVKKDCKDSTAIASSLFDQMSNTPAGTQIMNAAVSETLKITNFSPDQSSKEINKTVDPKDGGSGDKRPKTGGNGGTESTQRAVTTPVTPVPSTPSPAQNPGGVFNNFN